MSVNMRTHLPCDHKNGRICNNETIRSVRFHVVQFSEILPHSIQVIIMCQNISRHIYLYVVIVGKFYSLCHLFHGKIFRLGTETKGLATDIDSIRPIDHSNF